MLNYLSSYESVQVCLTLAIGACLLGLIITGQINRQINKSEQRRFDEQKWKESIADDEDRRNREMIQLKDQMAQNEQKRKLEWHLAQHPDHQSLIIDHKE